MRDCKNAHGERKGAQTRGDQQLLVQSQNPALRRLRVSRAVYGHICTHSC
jgi:hypothetical protein